VDQFEKYKVVVERATRTETLSLSEYRTSECGQAIQDHTRDCADLSEPLKQPQGKYPQTSTRTLEAGELQGLSADELGYMRNELFARHGMVFMVKKWKETFAKAPWYTPVAEDVGGLLSPLEQANLQRLLEAERAARK
jgi:hypothetical protein